MKSIDEELSEVEAESAAARVRLRAFEERYRAVLFGGTVVDPEQLRREIDSELELLDDLDKRNAAVRGRVDAAKQKIAEVERTVFNLATGALALSVTFSDSLIPEAPQSLNFLRIAWVLLTVSVVALPLSGFAELSDSAGLRPRRLFGLLKNAFPAIGFGSFFGGVVYFLLFALQNLPAPSP